jgi:hypothetical protein
MYVLFDFVEGKLFLHKVTTACDSHQGLQDGVPQVASTLSRELGTKKALIVMVSSEDRQEMLADIMCLVYLIKILCHRGFNVCDIDVLSNQKLPGISKFLESMAHTHGSGSVSEKNGMIHNQTGDKKLNNSDKAPSTARSESICSRSEAWADVVNYINQIVGPNPGNSQEVNAPTVINVRKKLEELLKGTKGGDVRFFG